MAVMQGFSGAMASDEVIKGAMFGYAFEHLEIAAYRNLITAARHLEDAGTADVCERILAEERLYQSSLPGFMMPLGSNTCLICSMSRSCIGSL
jgi:ferritin-like metal-binding protein YciE